MKLILVVDDNSDLCRTCMLALSSREYDVVVASDGVHALELLRSHDISLILTDLFMPEGGGNEFIAHAHREFPHVPVIAMSGGLEVEKRLQLAARRGAIQTLEKPFETAVLLAAVEQALVARPGATAS